MTQDLIKMATPVIVSSLQQGAVVAQGGECHVDRCQKRHQTQSPKRCGHAL